MRLYFYLYDGEPDIICISPSHPRWHKHSGNLWWHHDSEIPACAYTARKFLRSAKADDVKLPEHLTMVEIIKGNINTKSWEATQK